MVRVLTRAAAFLGSAALGLLLATVLVPEMSVRPRSFVAVVVVFAVLQSVLTPVVTALAARSAAVLVAAADLLSTVVALLVTSAWLGGLTIRGGPGP